MVFLLLSPRGNNEITHYSGWRLSERIFYAIFSKIGDVAVHAVVLECVRAETAQVLDAPFHAVQKAVPPAGIVVEFALGVEVQKASHVAEAHGAQRHPRHQIVVVDEAEAAGSEVLVEGLLCS